LCKADELKTEDWSFGCLYTSERKECDCGAPVLALVACTDCASLHLEGTISAARQLVPRRNNRIDEFELDAAEAEDDAEDAGRSRHDYADNGSPRLAQLFLYREFARRPKNRNSLESMGLVALSYPKLQLIDRTPLGCGSPLQPGRPRV
jgi:hypothetical protein